MSAELRMQIGVVSDTHFRSLREGIGFFEGLFQGPFAEVELILHAGDLGPPQLLDGVLDVPLLAVRGNTDGANANLPLQRVLELAGFRIGLIHGWGPLAGLEARVLGEFSGAGLDCLIYGHSHYPVCRQSDGLLLFNPGSPTDRRSAPCHSVGVLELGQTLNGRILALD